MTTPERSSGQKFADSLFSGVPYNVFTSDKGMELKHLQNIEKSLDKHHEAVERSLSRSTSHSGALRQQTQYLPPPEIIIDTTELAQSQQQVADRIEDVLNAQRDLVQATYRHTPLFKRMISNQGVTHGLLDQGNALSSFTNQHLQQGNHIAYQAAVQAFHQRDATVQELRLSNELGAERNDLLSDGNDISIQAAVQAFEQRSELIARLSQSVVQQGNMVCQLNDIRSTIKYEADQTRRHFYTLLTDLDTSIISLTNDQAITRMSMLQAIYRFQSTFLQSHEQLMLSHQHERGILERILEAAEMTASQKEARYLWKKAERMRKSADLTGALETLQQAHDHDDQDPFIYLSLGTIQSTYGNAERAASAFAEADSLFEGNDYLSAYTLMNLAHNLHLIGRDDHAERAMRKAMKMDFQNPEILFQYAKTCWHAKKTASARKCFETILQTFPKGSKVGNLYRAKVAVDADLTDIRDSIAM